MKTFSQKQATEELDAHADQVSDTEVESLLRQQNKIEDKVKSSGTLARFSADIELMFAMLRDYWQGHYRDIPWKSIAAVAGALLYVLNPLDLIPDIILGFGLLDDAGVIAICLNLVEADLYRYAAWRELSNIKTTIDH